MPRKKKPIGEMTKEELAKKFFPKRAKRELDKIDSLVKTLFEEVLAI